MTARTADPAEQPAEDVAAGAAPPARATSA
jgi:hypothetical protein